MPELQIKKVLMIIQRLFFLFLNKNKYCNPSLEQSQRDSSNEAGFFIDALCPLLLPILFCLFSVLI